MSGAPTDLAALSERFTRLRSFGALRRALRAAETVDGVASECVAFAKRDLEIGACAVYCAEGDDVDLRCVASDAAADASPFPESIPRDGALAAALAREPFARGVEPLSAAALAVPLRAAPDKLLGVFVAVAATALDPEVLEELAFDLESALSTRVMMQLRAEELAVLEIQERELVGLLRDVQERDAIIQQDLEEARQFQEKMLGPPPRVRGVSIEVAYHPLGLVGGDLYAISHRGDRLRLFVADATGHGVRAALTTMFIKSGYEAVTGSAADPAALLEALNDGIARTYRSAEMLFSAVCVDLDLSTGRMKLASAAHPPICIASAEGARFVEAGGAFLGLRPRIAFQMHDAELAPGDGLYLVTDGFAEACNDAGEQFGDERLLATISDSHAAGLPAGGALATAAAAYAKGGSLGDDATLLGVRFGVDAGSEAPMSDRDPT